MNSLKLVGKTAYINLTTGEISEKLTSERDIKNFLGGRGLNMVELYRNLPDPQKVDAFDPKNPLIIGIGLLVGTMAPNAARFNVSSKSPETGILGDANGGGFFGPAMKRAGYDRIIITGKAQKPCYLLLQEGGIIIKSAEHLWGLDTQSTQQMIWDTEGNDVEAICIGPAGENLVNFACIITRKKNSASRGGMGAVMGSKNLKAVVAYGTGRILIENPNEFYETVVGLKDYLNESRIVQTLRKVGTPLLYEPSHILGAIRTKNSQMTQFNESLKAEEFHKFSKGAMACAACVVHCRHANQQGGEGPEYSTVGLLGANCGIGDANQVIVLNNLCNSLGLDTSSTGTIIPWFFELVEKNLIPSDFSQDLEFGNFALLQSLIYQIAYRQGIGNWIADSTNAVKQIDPQNQQQAKELLIAVKGLPQSDPHDCRYIKSFALGIGTSSRGADHLRSRPTIELFDLPKEMTTKIYGKEVNTDPTAYEDKGWIVATHESIYAVGDALGICRFVTHTFNSPHLLKYDHFYELVRTSVGLEINNFREIGDRIINLERMFNLKCGISRKDDFPPVRYMTEPSTGGVSKGHLIEKEKYKRMLDEFYETRGWNLLGIPNKNQQKDIQILINQEP